MAQNREAGWLPMLMPTAWDIFPSRLQGSGGGEVVQVIPGQCAGNKPTYLVVLGHMKYPRTFSSMNVPSPNQSGSVFDILETSKGYVYWT